MHRIFLKGPWELASSTGPVRVHLPRDWEQVLAQGGETLRLSRRFHRPTGLSETSKVFVTVPANWRVAALHIGEVAISHSIIDGAVQRFDATDAIRANESHELTLTLPNAPGLSFLVAIEIADGIA